MMTREELKQKVSVIISATNTTGNEKRDAILSLFDVSKLLPSEEEIREPIQNALYATRNFFTDECTELSIGILEYLQDAGFKVVRQ